MSHFRLKGLTLMLVLGMVLLFTGCDGAATEDPPADTYEIDREVTWGYGEIELDPERATYEEGDSVEVTALPEANWEFDQWKGSLSGEEESQTVVVDSDLNIIAEFEPAEDIVGEGTDSDPYTVYTPEGLMKIEYDGEYGLDDYYELGYHINLSDEDWNPIGFAEGGSEDINLFTGKFDGQGYDVIAPEFTSEGFASGLFAALDGALVENINLVEVEVSGEDNVGGLAAVARVDTTIKNCFVEGSVDGSEVVGGIVGYFLLDGEISESYFDGEVSGEDYVGGMVGLQDPETKIKKSYAKASLHQTVEVEEGHFGGLVGDSSGKVVESYADGSVTAEGKHTVIGGLIGYLRDGGKVEDSYSIGEVSSNEVSAGGSLVGLNRGVIEKTYAAGNVEIEEGTIGGLVGSNDEGEVLNSYYDKEETGQDDTGKGTPKTTEEMMQEDTFKDWDFNNIWDIEEGESYPYLRWE